MLFLFLPYKNVEILPLPLDQQQILTLQANKKIEQLEIQLSTEDIPPDPPSKKSNADVAQEKRKGFFSRLFTK